MKKLSILLTLFLLAPMLLAACGHGAVKSESLFVRRVENLPEDFILGVDASSVLAEEASGVVYRGFDGRPQDVFRTLADCGVTHIRVRVWNHPFDAQGRGYGGGNCTAETAGEIGRRAAAAGMKLIVDFHYSDFWADPGKQMVPLAWKDLDAQAKSEALYAYTKESLEQIRAAGAEIGMVQIGNETNGALCGETTWDKVTLLMSAGSRAVREVCPEALVAVHFANPERSGSYADYADYLDYYGVDYDVFASSYYPFWHGTRENLAQVLGGIHRLYGKQVMVMETSYAFTLADTDFSGNTVSAESGLSGNYPFTVQGQANAVRDVVQTVADTPGGLGVCYWEGTWISVGQRSYEENSAIWERYGSGWASRWAASYDPEDAGRWYGGCAVDNQALFAPDGTPLESLKLFALLRRGNTPPLRADAAVDPELRFVPGDAITLPETVELIWSDNSRKEAAVTWAADEAELARLSAAGEDCTVSGTAEGVPVTARLRFAERNLLQNGDFETGELAPWVLTDEAGTQELFVEQKTSDSLDGEWHMHFWSPAKDKVAFTLEQELQVPEAGRYRFSISIMGGDCGESEVYAYICRGGELVGTAPMQITSFGNWDTGSIALACEAGETLTVGIRVRAPGAGAWGKIDGASFCVEN